MNTFRRISDIVSSNVNSVLDRMEDPEKMIDLSIRELEDAILSLKSDLRLTKNETEVNNNIIISMKDSIARWNERALLAAEKGEDEMAREALREKRALKERLKSAEESRLILEQSAKAGEESIREAEQKLKEMRATSASLKARAKIAKDRIALSKAGCEKKNLDSVRRAEEIRAKIERWESIADVNSLEGESKTGMNFEEMEREDEIETLTFEIARLENVEAEYKDAILQEFQDLMAAQNFISTGGIEYARELLEKSLGSQKAIDIINRLTSSLQVRPFDFIRRTDPAHLLNFIQQEHPQTIALILAYLEPNKASVILQGLPDEIQSDVARRIATMDRTSPDILREVERVLEKKLSTLSSEDYTAAGGVESIVEILNLVDRSSEKSIIEALEDEDPDLAEEIKKRMFVFEDIVMLDDRSIQKVLREVDGQELAKALKSVDAEVQDKIYRNMSKRAASMLKEDMEYMGPVRLKDVEEAQQKIVSIIRHLEDAGEIVIARNGEDEVLV